MWRNKKLRRSVPELKKQLSVGFALILYVRATGRQQLRTAIATRCPDFLPEQAERGLQKRPMKKGLINYYEFDEHGNDLGWRSFYAHRIVGWAVWDGLSPRPPL